jgi:aryl-alcohol dehydrogenase-like predicted oxidoreductase
MEYRMLGNTNLKVSALGLGGGGYSRLGLSHGQSTENAAAIVRRALELGLNIIDTAEAYGTETSIGQAIQGLPRQSLVLCTKTGAGSVEQPRNPKDLSRSLEQSLMNLGTDYIDLYQLHGVQAEEYPYVVNYLVPELLRLRAQGKIRFIGITERFETDPAHTMLQLASRDACWDCLMVGFNLLNTSARRTVFPSSRQHGMGILNMFAVRHALRSLANFHPVLQRLIDQGQVPRSEFDLENPLGFLLKEADSLPEAAYRYCLHDPDLHVVLSGTGSIAHLEENVRTAEKGPLSQSTVARLDRMFGKVDSESGKRPPKAD